MNREDMVNKQNYQEQNQIFHLDNQYNQVAQVVKLLDQISLNTFLEDKEYNQLDQWMECKLQHNITDRMTVL